MTEQPKRDVMNDFFELMKHGRYCERCLQTMSNCLNTIAMHKRATDV